MHDLELQLADAARIRKSDIQQMRHRASQAEELRILALCTEVERLQQVVQHTHGLLMSCELSGSNEDLIRSAIGKLGLEVLSYPGRDYAELPKD